MSDCGSASSMSDSELGAVANVRSVEKNSSERDSPSPDTSADAMSAFLAKKRSELMYEIRHLKHGERPVTGGESRKNIDDFMTRRAEASAKAEHDLPANMDNVEQHRPEAVVVEVQGLFERRPVSSLLQSLRFRRTLENAIRHGLSNVPSLQPQQRRSVAANRERSNSNSSTSSSQVGARTPSVSSHGSASDHISEEVRPQVTPRVVSPLAIPSGSPVQRSNIPVPPPLPTEQVNNVPQPWLLQAVSESQLQDYPELQLEDMYREDLVAEISDLVHRQLVTQTLHGNFRATLELQMQDHLARTGTDGNVVLETLHGLPRTQDIQRNDFSHLGIQAPGQDFDNISIVSASAAAVPYAQSNLALNREMQAMKSQLAELRNMMQLSFTMQMDIQRAIRQEVAAAMTQQAGAEAAPPTPRVQTRPANDTSCLICLDNAADAVLYQCGHMCTCYTCGLNLQSRNNKCPVCRAPIKDIIRLFQCNTKKDES